MCRRIIKNAMLQSFKKQKYHPRFIGILYHVPAMCLEPVSCDIDLP